MGTVLYSYVPHFLYLYNLYLLINKSLHTITILAGDYFSLAYITNYILYNAHLYIYIANNIIIIIYFILFISNVLIRHKQEVRK